VDLKVKKHPFRNQPAWFCWEQVFWAPPQVFVSGSERNKTGNSLAFKLFSIIAKENVF
jgi:hypothetical protein